MTLFVCWSLTSLCHSNGHIETMPRNDRELLDRTEGVLGSGNRLVPISPVERDGGSWSVAPPVSRARKNRRGMRPDGRIRPCPQRVKNELMDGEGKTHVIPLSVEFSLKTESKSRVATRSGSDGSVDDLPPRTGPEKIVKRRDAVGLTTAMDGAATIAEIAGAAAPADLAEILGCC